MIAHLVLALAPIAVPQSSASGFAAAHPTKSAPAIRAAGASTNALTLTRIEFNPAVSESAPLISGIRLLPIEIAGRTPLSEPGTACGTVVAIGAAGTAAQLPGAGAIRIFHYQKPQAKLFGFFALRGPGEFQSLIERPGLGGNGTIDPFDPVIGVARDGRTIAITASDPNHGVSGLGDTWLVRCDGQPFSTGAFLRELTGVVDEDVAGVSLTFFGNGLYAVLEDALVVAAADGTTSFSDVPIPAFSGGPVAEIAGEMVISAQGNKLAILAGSDEDHLDLYVMSLDGTIVNVTQDPRPLVTPEFLPESTEGPLLALSPDGKFVTYQLDAPNGNELFMSATTPGATPIHLTSDPIFDTSIDQMSGILTGGTFTHFLAASGQLNADLYRSTLPGSGTPILANLTKTSGAEQPFFPNLATLHVRAQASLREGRLLIDDRTAQNAGFDLWFDTASDIAGIALSGMDQAPKVVASASEGQSLAITGSAGAQSFLMAFDGWSAPRHLLHLPPGVTLGSIAVRDGGTVFAVAAEVAGMTYIVQLAASGGALNLVQGAPFAAARDLLYGRDQRLLFTANTGAAAQTYFVNASQQAVAAGTPAPIAFWLR